MWSYSGSNGLEKHQKFLKSAIFHIFWTLEPYHPYIQSNLSFFLVHTGLLKINRTLLFTYKIKSFFFAQTCPLDEIIFIQFLGCPGKDIFNITAVVLIFQKDPCFYADHVTVHSH